MFVMHLAWGQSAGEQGNMTDSDGLKQGWWYEYYPNGKLSAKTYYKDDKIDSIATQYWKNGQELTVIRYEDGVKQGSYKAYRKNGHLLVEGFYKHGALHGEGKLYRNDGSLQTLTTFDLNTVVEGIVYRKDGSVKKECVAQGEVIERGAKYQCGYCKFKDRAGNVTKTKPEYCEASESTVKVRVK